MPLTDDFDGSLASGQSVTVVTANGAGTSVPIQGIENIQWPKRSFKEDKYTPLTGTYSGKEHIILCSEEAGELTATLTYEKAHQAAMDAVCGVNGCQITLVLGDGLTLTAKGGIKQLGTGRMEDSKHVTSDISVSMNAGWTLVDNAAATIVPSYTVSMTSGAATIDLTGCGLSGTVNLTGKKLTKLVLTAPSTNANAVTVATGGTNGYAVTSAFSQVLAAGESITVDLTSVAPTVASGAKTLDVTGTGAQAVKVYIEAA